MEDAALWEFEERFWREGSPVDEEHLDPGCLMALPGIGIMRAPEILESLKDAPRWEAVQMIDRVTGHAGGGITVLGYRAVAWRARMAPYVVYCTSTYRPDGETWKLVQHQQTIAG